MFIRQRAAIGASVLACGPAGIMASRVLTFQDKVFTFTVILETSCDIFTPSYRTVTAALVVIIAIIYGAFTFDLKQPGCLTARLEGS